MNGEKLAILVLVVAALWVALAAALSILAVVRLRRARAVIGAARDLRLLLDRSPARPLVIRPDGAIEADRDLAAELDLATTSGDVALLDGRIEADDLAALREDVRSVALGAAGARRMVRLANGQTVEVRYALAPPPQPPGTVIAWFLEIDQSEAERSRLAGRLAQTESALDALTHLIESAPFPMWYRGPDLSLGLVNAAFVNAVEAKDAADVIARGSELVDATGADSARTGAQVALASGRPHSRTQPATIGGERRMMKLVDVPLPTGAVAGFAIDIQDLEDARIELASNIRSQRDLADRMTAGAVQFDSEQVVDFFNSPFAQMARLEPEWLADHPNFDRLLEKMRDTGRLPEVRDFPAWKAEKRGWFTATQEMIEEDWILANGDHWRIVAQPLPDGGLRLIVEDRTEQVRLASARDTLLRVRTATFDNLFEAIGVFASDSRLYLWNRRFSEVWGLDESWLAEHPRVDELLPALAKRLVNPTAAAQVRELVRSTTTGRQSGTGNIVTTDGRHFDFAAVPLPDGNALFTMVDVTDSARIEAALRERATALEQADRVKTDFVANMSYELRTPLTSIGGFAEMLGAGYAGKLPQSARDYVEAILESVGRLSKMIDEVLDLTQGDTQGVTLERERTDVGGLCRAVVDAMKPRASDKKQQLDLVIEPSAGQVIGDSRRLRESLEHVLRNAVLYSPEGGSITVSAAGNDDEAIVTIRDNGPGIDEAQQRSVFTRFHRAEGTRREAGLGLGLPLTRQFIEAHGGSVELVSAPGEGTAVTIVIPRAPR